MSGSGMWKPGMSKPSAKSAPDRPKDDEKTQLNTKKKESGDGGGGSKKLSGATLNMRFMQRKRPKPSSSSRKIAEEEGGATDSMEIDTEPSSTQGPQHDEGSNATSAVAHAAAHQDEPYTRATCADMHGIQGSVLGRRSFGGFNRHMEDAWNRSYQTLRSEKPLASSMTDEELLQRYADHQHVQNNGLRGEGSSHVAPHTAKRRRKNQISKRPKKS